MTTHGTWGLVTGSSSGLDVELAKGLARRGINLVLTARLEAAMQTLADDLVRDFGIEVVVEPLDLARPGSAAVLSERLLDRGQDLDILVNNAGFGLYEPFVDHDADRLHQMLQLDIVSLVELTQLFARRMARQKGGRILLVGSMAAYQPIANMAAYAASKAFVLLFGEALHAELTPDVVVTVFSPGLMDTGFNASSGYETPVAMDPMKLAPETGATIGSDAMFDGRSGRRLFPRRLAELTHASLEHLALIAGFIGMVRLRRRGRPSWRSFPFSVADRETAAHVLGVFDLVQQGKLVVLVGNPSLPVGVDQRIVLAEPERARALARSEQCRRAEHRPFEVARLRPQHTQEVAPAAGLPVVGIRKVRRVDDINIWSGLEAAGAAADTAASHAGSAHGV